MKTELVLCEVPRRNYVQILDDTVAIPPANPIIEHNEIVWFSHLDGMYSYCIDSKGNLVHPSVWTKVRIIPVEEVPEEIIMAVTQSKWNR